MEKKFTTIRVYERSAKELREYAEKWNLNLAQVVSRLLDVFYGEQLNAVGSYDRVRDRLIKAGFVPDLNQKPND